MGSLRWGASLTAPMADVQPFRALHYNLDAAGGLQALTAPPYDVIDDEQRAELVARSPHNVVEIDLPQGDDPYGTAARTFGEWQAEGVLTRDEDPALWVLPGDGLGWYDATAGGRWIGPRVELWIYSRRSSDVSVRLRSLPGMKVDEAPSQIVQWTAFNLSDPVNLVLGPDETLTGGPAEKGSLTC